MDFVNSATMNGILQLIVIVFDIITETSRRAIISANNKIQIKHAKRYKLYKPWE